VHEGARLAQSLGAEMRLLCLVPPLAPWALEAGAEAGYRRSDVERHHLGPFAHALEAAMGEVPPGVPVEGRMLEGRPAPTLERELRQGVDLLVMASPGARPIAGVRPGATALAAMRCAPCPVLLTQTGVRKTADRLPLPAS